MRQLLGELHRRHYGRLVGSLTRMLGAHRLHVAEECAQDAMIRALESWPFHGVPPNPEAWLFTAARRRAIDMLRREKLPVEPLLLEEKPEGDERLAMMFLCCHAALDPVTQVALTLQVVCGLNAREIARGLMQPEHAMAQKLVRAKRRLRESGARFHEEGDPATVMAALYLLFNEGYAATESTTGWYRADLCDEAIYLARLTTATRRPEAHALLALFLLQASRLPARISAEGEAIPLPHQNRALWNRRAIAEGFAQLDASASGGLLSAYHVEAEIAAVHAAAPSFADTAWERIVSLYDRLPDSPAVRLNRAVALGYRDGPVAGLEVLNGLPDTGSHLLPAARAEFLWQLGRRPEAAFEYATAAARARTGPERLYLERRSANVDA